jgi:hypothetical protein
MDTLKPLTDFFSAIEKDFRISSTHIAIYAALLQYRQVKGFINPINAYRYEIMEIAKISGPYTYHKCMKELSEYGYIRYVPTRKRNQRSAVHFSE